MVFMKFSLLPQRFLQAAWKNVNRLAPVESETGSWAVSKTPRELLRGEGGFKSSYLAVKVKCDLIVIPV